MGKEKIEDLACVTLLIWVILVGSACNKETLDGVPGGPSEEMFSGCRLSKVGLYDITYNADGSLKNLGDWIYHYNENEVVVYFGKNTLDGRIILLDNRGIPKRSISFNNLDSVYARYLYNENDYLIKVYQTYKVEGIPHGEFEIIYKYDDSGNRTQVLYSVNDTVVQKVSFKYDYTKLDNRNDFFERAHINPVSNFDFSDVIPLDLYYGNCMGRWNTNLVKEISVEYNGNTTVYDLKNYFDGKGNLIKTDYKQNRVPIGTDTYFYTCK